MENQYNIIVYISHCNTAIQLYYLGWGCIRCRTYSFCTHRSSGKQRSGWCK